MIDQEDPQPAARIVHGNPPAFLTPLLGREHEVKQACAVLQHPDIRVLTLVGPGGVGKTRLGLAVATQLSASFADGVYFVSLAPLNDQAFVLSTIAQQLAVKETGEQPLLDLLITALHTKHLLLLLDNLEHLVTIAPSLARLVAACPRLTLLVTSRAVLRLEGEHTFPVPPLALPNLTHLPGQEALVEQPAVALFLQRAQAIQPGFLLTAENAQAIAEICVHLDGLPLAIELAAARIRLLEPYALQARLTQRFAILTKGAMTLPPRQRTLRQTLQWSYDLLDFHEQRLFRQISIFVGGFTLEAAEAVCGALRRENQEEGAARSILDGVDSLLEKSLLYQVKLQAEELRLAMLETVREYGLECLTTSGELESTRQAHARYYQALACEAGSDTRRPDTGKWLDRLEQERDNLRAVLNGLLTQGEVEQALLLCNDLFWFWWIRDPREGRMFLERGLAAQGSVARDIRGWSLQTLGILVSNQGNYTHAVDLWKESLALFQEAEGTLGRAWALSNIGIATMYQGAYIEARQVLEKSLTLFRELEDVGAEYPAQVGSLPVSNGVAFTLFRLASIANLQGEYARARTLAEESLPLLKAMGDTLRIPPVLEILASAALNQGDYTRAQTILAEKLTIEQKGGIKRDIGLTLALQGQLAFLQGETDKAHALLTEGMALLQEIAPSWMPSQDNLAEALSLLGRVVTRQGDLARSQTLHEESLAAARHMTKPQIIAFSLEGLAENAMTQGKPAWAARLWGAAEKLRETAVTPLPTAWRQNYQRAIANVRSALGEQVFSAHWAAGRTLPLEQILAEREPAPFLPPAKATVSFPTSPTRLTPREMDVLRLLAQGLTNAQIAEQLIIGLVTVNFHVRSIYSKLGVTSRTAATRYAMEHHLL